MTRADDPPPLPTLLSRLRRELAASFDPERPVRLSRAGLGGTAAGVALQRRGDGEVQVFSFNRLDDHRPFQLRMPLARLAAASRAELSRELADAGRSWAGAALASLHVLRESTGVDLRAAGGLNIATLVEGDEAGAGAAEAAAMLANLVHDLELRKLWDGSGGDPVEGVLGVLAITGVDSPGEEALREAIAGVAVVER